MANYCHLSYEDRKNIEDGLNNKKSVNQIAKELNRSHSTILREIDRNKVYYNPVIGIIVITIKIKIIPVINYLNHLMFVMDVNLEVGVEKKDLLIMLEKRMILIKNLLVLVDKVLI